MTYEYILSRMIDRVMVKHPNLDRREGSIVFDACASAALELAIVYDEIANANRESFVPTATREYKIVGCRDVGMDVSMFEAHAGVFKGEFNVKVSIGARVNCDIYNYVVTEYIGMDGEHHAYKMECETIGSAPNNVRGSLTFITDMPEGLSYAELTDCLIEGENETSDEDINIAFEEHVNSSDDDGNVNQYKKWCDEYDGIGNAKIFPLWNGANTVKVSILSASNRRATQELVNSFQEFIDPNITGMGDGAAPIGAFVTVTTASEKTINVSATVTMKNGYSNTSVIDEALERYFQNISYEKAQVAYMNVGAEILNVDGVESISNLKLNGGTADITLGDEEIPVVGTTNWVVT